MKIYLGNYSLKFLAGACAWYDEWDWHVEAHYPVDLFSQQMFWLVIAEKTQLQLITLTMALFCLSALSPPSKLHSKLVHVTPGSWKRKPKSKTAIIVINYTCVYTVLVSAVKKPYSVSKRNWRNVHTPWTFTIFARWLSSVTFLFKHLLLP